MLKLGSFIARDANVPAVLLFLLPREISEGVTEHSEKYAVFQELQNVKIFQMADIC